MNNKISDVKLNNNRLNHHIFAFNTIFQKSISKDNIHKHNGTETTQQHTSNINLSTY